MKKAVRIVSIVSIIYLLVFLGVLISYLFFIDAIVGWSANIAANNGQPIDESTMSIIRIALYATFIAIAVCMIPGIVFAFLIKKENELEQPSRATMITYGVLEIIFGFPPLGVVSIVRGCKNRQ